MSHESSPSLVQSEMVPRHEIYQDQESQDRYNAATLAAEASTLTAHQDKQFGEVRHSEQVNGFTHDNITKYSVMRKEAPKLPDGSHDPFNAPTFAYRIDKSVTQGTGETPGFAYVELGLDGEIKHAYVEEYADGIVKRHDMSEDPKSGELTQRDAINAAAEVMAVIKHQAEL